MFHSLFDEFDHLFSIKFISSAVNVIDLAVISSLTFIGVFRRFEPKIYKWWISRHYFDPRYIETSAISSFYITIALFQNPLFTSILLRCLHFIALEILQVDNWHKSDLDMSFNLYFGVKLTCVTVNPLLVLLFILLSHCNSLRINSFVFFNAVE
jgi:hypothetical protein